MKNNKLNAVVASILSLGIVCSGSVFASGKGQGQKRIGKKTVICTREEMLRGAEILRGISRRKIEVKPKNEIVEGPKLRRCNATLNKSTFEKARMASKPQKSKLHSVKKAKNETVDVLEGKMTSMEAIKTLLDGKLETIRNCSKKWENLNPILDMKIFEELPLNSKEFILKSLSCHDELHGILRSLEAQSVMNLLKHESNIFSDLQKICDEIYNQYGEK